MENVSKRCRRHSRASVLLRTLTKHAKIGGTVDIPGGRRQSDVKKQKAWGYEGVMALRTKENIIHSETYAIFAQGKQRSVLKAIDLCANAHEDVYASQFGQC